jgi:hypothetical protein
MTTRVSSLQAFKPFSHVLTPVSTTRAHTHTALGSSSGKVSFDQFLETFALLEPLDLVAIFDKEANFFRLGSAGDLAQLLENKPLTRRESIKIQEKSAKNENLALRLFAAGVAATLAQTACQPIETIKVLHMDTTPPPPNTAQRNTTRSLPRSQTVM